MSVPISADMIDMRLSVELSCVLGVDSKLRDLFFLILKFMYTIECEKIISVRHVLVYLRSSHAQ